MAWSDDEPHISREGCRLPQTAGRSGFPKSAQRLSAVSWTHLTPAGFPWGIPGTGELMEGAMQQAPQPSRQATGEGSPGGEKELMMVLLITHETGDPAGEKTNPGHVDAEQEPPPSKTVQGDRLSWTKLKVSRTVSPTLAKRAATPITCLTDILPR